MFPTARQSPATDSCAVVLERLRVGDEAAAREIFVRFRDRLVALARQRLRRRLRSKVDPEDVLQSVLRSFFTRQRAGEFRATSWDSLWNLLAVMTARKCVNHGERFRRARRDVDREARIDGGKHAGEAFSRDPSPSHAAVVAETLDRLVRCLYERDRAVLVLHLEGYTVSEIALRIGRTERTVRRALGRIRGELERFEFEGGADPCTGTRS